MPGVRVLRAKAHSVDGFEVGRALPQVHQRAVGPFVFVDHIGPSRLPEGQGLDVRPHPHINLATVTYLFEGSFLHRDSLGNEQVIGPGAVNWMVAGSGIVHSERSPAAERAAGPSLHGIQLWVALPQADEECEPSFTHHAADTLPEFTHDGARCRLLLGSAFGLTSPVRVFSPMWYVEVQLGAGGKFTVPAAYRERAVYWVQGTGECEGAQLTRHDLALLEPGRALQVSAGEASRFMLLGGEPLDGPRHIWWNFVSSSQQRIIDAARRWKEGGYPKVPGDEQEFIPLTDEPPFS